MSHRETRRHGVKGRIRTSCIFFFFAALRVSSDRFGCGAVVFQVNFFNQICEVLSGMSCPTHSLHYINLIECRCVHVIRFTFSSFSRVLAPWSEFLIEVHRWEDLKWYRSTLRQRRKHNERTCENLRLGLERRNSWHALPSLKDVRECVADAILSSSHQCGLPMLAQRKLPR